MTSPAISEIINREVETTITHLDNVLLIRSIDNPALTRFIPESFLGIGAYGLVVKAWDRDLNQWVAIKIQASKGRQYADTFKKEYQISRDGESMFGERSPVPHSYDLIQIDDAYYHVMNFIPGQSAYERWRSNRSETPKDPQAIKSDIAELRDIGQEIEKLHKMGFAHLDIKPGNIMIPPSGPMLLDAGLATQFDIPSGLASTPPKGATSSYASPELIAYFNGTSLLYGHISAPSDVYSYAKIVDERLDSLVRTLGEKPTLQQANIIQLIKKFQKDVVSRGLRNEPSERPNINEFTLGLNRLSQVISNP